MSMLNFKYGSFKNLPEVSNATNGTIYVTTDEKAMYVDLDNTRIRLSQIITLADTKEWQDLVPPYSTEAFYYIVEANALLKYNGTGSDEKWTQINSTTALSEALTALATKVGGIETTVGQHGTAITGIQNTINDTTTGLAATKKIADEAKATANAALPKNEFTTWRDGANKTAIEDAKKAGTDAQTAITNHIADKNNPHQVTAALIGLGNVNNTADLDKPVSTAQQTAINTAKNAVLGTNTDTSAKDTVFGAKAAAADALQYATDVNTALGTYKTDNDAVIRGIKNGTNINSFGSVEAELTSKYATQTYAQNQAKAVLGDADDGVGDNTVYGAHAHAKAAQTAAASAQETADNNTTAINTQKDRIDAILKDANVNMKTFKQVYDAIEDVRGDITNLNAEYATDKEVADIITALRGGYDGTIKAVHDVASGAQTAATTANNDIAAIRNGTTISDFAGVESALDDVQDTFNNLDATFVNNDELDRVKKEILGEGHTGTVKQAYDLANTTSTNLTTLQGIVSGIKNGTINNFQGVEQKISNIETTIKNLDGTYATDTELTNAISNLNTTLRGVIDGVDDKVDANAQNIQKNASAITNLRNDVTSSLQVADALKYKGALNSADSLPSSGVEIGWTYKVTTDIAKSTLKDKNVNFATSEEDEPYVRIGDLLIATGTETNGVITSNLKWDHVPSGYHADYVPEMTTDFTSGNTADIQLTSAHGTDLGNFQITGATGSNITISNPNGNVIAIGMTWGTF